MVASSGSESGDSTTSCTPSHQNGSVARQVSDTGTGECSVNSSASIREKGKRVGLPELQVACDSGGTPFHDAWVAEGHERLTEFCSILLRDLAVLNSFFNELAQPELQNSARLTALKDRLS